MFRSWSGTGLRGRRILVKLWNRSIIFVTEIAVPETLLGRMQIMRCSMVCLPYRGGSHIRWLLLWRHCSCKGNTRYIQWSRLSGTWAVLDQLQDNCMEQNELAWCLLLRFSASHWSKVVLLDWWRGLPNCGMYQKAVVRMCLYVFSGEFNSGPEIWVRRLAAYGTKVNHHYVFQVVQNSGRILLSNFCIFRPTDSLVCIILPWWKRLIFMEIWECAHHILICTSDNGHLESILIVVNQN